MNEICNQLQQHGYALLFDAISHEPEDIISLRMALLEFLATVFTPVCFFRQPLTMNITAHQSGLPRSSAGAASFPLHTDVCWVRHPPDYVAMYCIDYDRKGDGLQFICDSHNVLESLQQRTIVDLLQTKFHFFPPKNISSRPLIRGILDVTSAEMEYKIRFRQDLMSPANRGLAAGLIKECDNMSQVMPQVRNSLLILDNTRMLHGRAAIRNWQDSNRHYVRVYGRKNA